MIELGKYNELKVTRKDAEGFYFENDDQWGEILLLKKNAPAGLEIGDDIEVFIYFDSEDTIIATTQRPYATVGDFCYLRVKSLESFGVFLDWGLEKDLFVPFREQPIEMKLDHSYVVYIYVDSSNRISASTRLTKYITNTEPPFKNGDTVNLLLVQNTDLGIKAIINGSHYGLLYKNDLHRKLTIGQKIEAYIKNIRDDNKIDLTLTQNNIQGRDDLTKAIIEKLQAANGFLDINSKTASTTINSMFGVSRNKFKMALGHLYKSKIVSTDDTGTKLLN